MFGFEVVRRDGEQQVIEVATGELAREEVVFHAPDEGSAHAVAAALASYWTGAFAGEWIAPRRTVYPVSVRRRAVQAA